VRHIVELHGGTVRAQSPGAGQGATFTVELLALNETGTVVRRGVVSDSIGIAPHL